MSIYNEDELVAPNWINNDFLETVLQQYENNKLIKVRTRTSTNFSEMLVNLTSF